MFTGLKDSFRKAMLRRQVETFFKACLTGDKAVIADFIRQWPEVVFEKDSGGWTGVMKAAFYGRDKAIMLLEAAGADVNAKANDAVTAIALAAMNRRWKTVELLLDYGANIETPDETGETPLMTAARTGSVDAAKMLLKRGANVDAVNYYSATARMLAVERASHEIVKILDDVRQNLQQQREEKEQQEKGRQLEEDLTTIESIIHGGLRRPIPYRPLFRSAPKNR